MKNSSAVFVLRALSEAEREKFRVYVLSLRKDPVGEGKMQKSFSFSAERASACTHVDRYSSFVVSSLKTFAFRRRSFFHA